MRIAMIGQKGMPARDGGVERHVHDLAVRLHKSNFDVTVYNRKWYAQPNVSNIEGVQIVQLPTLHTKHLDTIIHTLFATVHAMYHGHDILHYHGIGPSLLSWIPRVFTPRIKVVTTFHSMDRKHEKWGVFAKFMLRLGEYTACKFSHTLIAVSPTIEQYARDVYDKKSSFIPNAVHVQAPLEKKEVLSKWNLQKENYIVMISRLIPHKGAHYLIDAWKQLQTQEFTLIGDKKLVIVGDGYYTDEYVKNLKEKAKGNDSIVFTGFQNGDTLRTLHSQALFQVHPSDNEGLPICVLEGMSFARPILLSNIPEHRDINGDEEALFQYGSVDDLKEKLTFFLSLTDAERKKKGLLNKKIIEKYYTWDTVAEKIENLYQSHAVLQLQKNAVHA